MQLQQLEYLLESVPYLLRQQVLEYAKSVGNASHEIFRDAGIEFSEELNEKLVFISGVRKLYSIVVSHFWILDNSLEKFKNEDVSIVKIGSTKYSKSSSAYRSIRALKNDLELALEKQNLRMYIFCPTYQNVLELLTGKY